MKSPFAVIREQYRGWSKAQRVLAALLAAILCVILVESGRRSGDKTLPVPRPPEQLSSPEALQSEKLYPSPDRLEPSGLASSQGLTTGLDLPPDSRLIVHTAELSVCTQEFAKSRSSLQEILDRHRGYAAKLRMVGQRRASMLSATLRVPTTELNGTVSDLKSLGHVEREEQTADEVTEQRADLEARLGNAQSRLRRLRELLEKQSYPDGNVRDLERQITSVTAEIARLEAEGRASENRVVFANVAFTLREEVAAAARSESLGAQLRAATEAGFGEALASLVGLLVFVIERGPVALLWCAVLFFPVRFAWKKCQQLGRAPAAAQAD